MNASDHPTPQLPELPYRGIESFRFIDHPIFCARRREADRLLRWITIYRGVLLYGAPSIGKSSLVNAGLLPAALGDGFSPMRIRVQPRPGEEVIVERVALTDEGTPPYLPSVLAPDEDSAARMVLPAAALVQRLRERGDGPLPLLVFDQFEEFVTLFEEAPRGEEQQRAAAIAQRALLEAITELLRDHSFAAKLLFSFREDYFGKLHRLFARYPSLLDLGVRLLPVEKAALPEIIRGPFRTSELRRHFDRELPEPLIVELTRQIEVRSQGAALNLTEVQIACLRLWQAADPGTLLQRRGVQGLMEDYLAESLDRLGRLRGPAVALLSRMVTAQGTRNVISEDNLLRSTANEEKLPEEILKATLEALEGKTALVRKESRNEIYVYEIVSEFLVPWIRRQRNESEQRRRQQQFQRRTLGFAAVVLIVLVSGLVAKASWVSKDKAVIAAREEANEATRELAAAEQRVQRLEAESLEVATRHAAALALMATESQTAIHDRDSALEVLRRNLAESDGRQRALAERVIALTATAEENGYSLTSCRGALATMTSQAQQLREQLAASQVKAQADERAAGLVRQRLTELERFGETCPAIQLSGKLVTEIGGLRSNLSLLETALPRIKCTAFSSDATLAMAQVRLHRDRAEQGVETIHRLIDQLMYTRP